MPHIPSSPEAQLEQLRSRDQRYRLGQFFTPEPAADLMAQAILAIDPEMFLGPGGGGGVLLRAVSDGPKLYGLDIDGSEGGFLKFETQAGFRTSGSKTPASSSATVQCHLAEGVLHARARCLPGKTKGIGCSFSLLLSECTHSS
jgi:hypothetical protein